MKTLAEQYQGRRKTIENYCRKGLKVKEMARKFDIDPVKMRNIIRTLNISILRLRNEGYNNVK